MLTTFLSRSQNAKYVLQLFVAGATPRSTNAIRNLTRICQEHLAGRYDLQVIDLYQQPERARSEQILAVPTLVKKSPEPFRKFLGDMSNEQQLLAGLGLA